MAKEVERYFVRRLQTVLSEYLKDFSQNNVAKFSLGISNNILLENLQIRKDVLMKFHIPMYIIEGKIGRINLRMPINYKQNQSQMLIENVELTVSSISETSLIGITKDKKRADSEQGLSEQENYKKQKLRLWEEKMVKYFETLSPPNWIQQIVDNIYDNMSITIKKFTLTFKNTSLQGYETLLKVKFDELSIQTTDSNWEPRFNADPKQQFKVLLLQKFCVILNAQPFSEQQYNNKNSRESEHYIIHPIDGELKITKRKMPQPLQALQAIYLNFQGPLIIMLNKDQKNYVMKLNQHIKNLEIIQDNFHFRPQVPVQKNWIEWWKYSIQAVLEKQKQFKLDLNFSSHRIVLMKQYISLYKKKQNIIHVPWLKQWTIQDEQKFQNCERVLQLKDLIKYREWAFTEIRLEAKRYFNSSKDGTDGKGVKPLLDLWTSTINNGNAFLDKNKAFEDDVPVELEESEKINLYEILERDQSQVLNQYLQGQNYSPDQRELEIDFNISSLFLFLLEERLGDQNVFYSPENVRMFEHCKCSRCIKKQEKVFQQRKTTIPPKVKQSKQQSYKGNSKPTSNQFTQFKKQKQEDELDGSFVTAKGQNDNEDSFASDLNDLNANQEFMDQQQNDINNLSDATQNQQIKWSTQKSMRLFLIIEFRQIQGGMYHSKNGSLETKQDKPFTIQDINIMSPGYLSKYLQRQGKNDQKLRSKQFVDFLKEIFEISSSKDPVFLNSEQTFKCLIEFLNINKMSHIADFLERFENNKVYFQDFGPEDFIPFNTFLDTTKDEYLHFLKGHIIQNSQDIEELHTHVLRKVKNFLFPAFLEQYGEQILPPCIEYLKQKGDYQTHKKHYNERVLQIDFQLSGKRPEFEIIPLQKSQSMRKMQISKTNNKIQETNEDAQNPFVKIKFRQVNVHISARALKSLLKFMHAPDNHQQVSHKSLFINQNHMLLECIMKSPPLVSSKNESRVQVDFQLEKKFKIFVLSEAVYIRTHTKTKIEFSGVKFQTLQFNEIEKQKIPNLRTLLDRHRSFYTIMHVQLEDFSIMHKLLKKFVQKLKKQKPLEEQNNQQQNPEKNQSDYQKVLSFGLNILIIKAKVPNHAILTDQKVYIQIPSIRLEITDSITGLFELVQILKSTQVDTVVVEQQEMNNQGYQHSTDSILIAELQALFRDHTVNNSNCRHCIIKFRKSNFLMNLIIGDMGELIQQIDQRLEATWFALLQNLCTKKEQNRLKYIQNGLEVEFNHMNRVSKQQQQTSTVLCLPFIIVTKDNGFFKDNLTILCKKSYGFENGYRKIKKVEEEKKEEPMTTEINFIGIVPYQKEDNDILPKLDERHAFYCRILEGKIFKQDFHLKEQITGDPENQLYIIAYRHQPVRYELLEKIEHQIKKKSLKTQIYFRIRKISLNFFSPLAACTVFSIYNNAQQAMKIIEYAWRKIYDKKMVQSVNHPQILEGSQQQSPLKILDKQILLITIGSISAEMKISQDQYVKFIANSFNIHYNLDLIDQKQDSPLQIKNSVITNPSYKIFQHSRTSEEHQTQIFSCLEIMLSFSGETELKIQEIAFNRNINTLSLTVRSIRIQNPKAQNDLRNLMNLPKNNDIDAIHIQIDFAGLTDIRIQMAPMSVSFSKENIQEFIQSVNTIFVIIIQEMREYKSFLKRTVFVTTYTERSLDKAEFFKSNKVDQTNSDIQKTIQQQYRISFTLENITILFCRDRKVFCQVGLQAIWIQRKNNGEIEAEIKDLTYKPYPVIPDIQSQRVMYPSLISQNNDNTPIRIRLTQGQNNQIQIQIENIELKFLSVYFNELAAFAKTLQNELVQSSKELQIKKPKERQVLEELDRQIRGFKKIKIGIYNTSILIPENSNSQNYIRLDFEKADIFISKRKLTVQVPLLQADSNGLQSNQVAIDYSEETESQVVHANYIQITLDHVDAIYNLVQNNLPQGKLFRSERINANIDIPILQPLMFGNWQYKQTLRINLSKLNLQLDFGKMKEIQKLVESNTQEKSQLFQFDPPTLSKLNLNVNIDSMSFSTEKFVHQSEPIKLFRNEKE